MKHLTLGALVASLLVSVAAPVAAQELVFSVSPRGYGEVVPNHIEAFQAANPGTTVEWLRAPAVPGDARQIYVTNLIGGGATPDVFATDIIWVGEFAQRGWLEPLDGLISEDLRAQYNTAFVDAATVDGQLFAAPLYVDGTHLFYRTDLLEEYGFEAPTTWEELIAQSQAILEGEGNPQLNGFVSMWAPIEGLFMNYLSFLGGAGGTFFDADGNVAVESEASLQALSTMASMVHDLELAPDSILSMRPDDARTLFQQGRSVFLMVQDFALATLTAEDSPVRDDVAFTRIPYFDGNEDANSTALGGWLLGINPNSEHKEAAAELVSFMTSSEGQLWAALNASRAPGNLAVYDDPALVNSDGPLAGFVQNYAVGVARPSAATGANYPQVSEIMQTEITNALHERKTPQEAMADAAEQIRAVLGQ